ncbi:TPA: hypothetical protein TZ318_002109 [Streptococcus suis]|nr:hypothetical protein [Streptococcus suis]
MNKQEVIRSMQREQFHVPYGPGIFVHAVFMDKAIELINQIHEPQKVVVPKFVAEWYERNKERKLVRYSPSKNPIAVRVGDEYYKIGGIKQCTKMNFK